MYAFVSHESACEALRALSSGAESLDTVSRWPPRARGLPGSEHCVSGQRDFKDARLGERLRAIGCVSRPVDLTVPTQSSRSNGASARFHVWGGVLPVRSLIRPHADLLVFGPELVVIQLCASQGKLDDLLDAHAEAYHAEAEVVAELGLDDKPVIDHPLHWERIRRLVAATLVASEFAGTYRLGGEKGVSYNVKPLMSSESLERVSVEVGDSQGTRRARRVSRLMLEGSASPMETVLALMLSLPLDFGGFGLEKPQLNHPIDVSAHNGGISDRDVVTPDFLWARQMIVLEYDSEEFHAALGDGRSRRDATRTNILAALGYRTLRATPQMIRSLPGLELLARQIAEALGETLPKATPLQALRRRKLFLQLMPLVRE